MITANTPPFIFNQYVKIVMMIEAKGHDILVA
jgi:hypothetical protein